MLARSAAAVSGRRNWRGAVLVPLALLAVCSACRAGLPVDINVAGGSQSRPNPILPSPEPDVRKPPRERPPSDPSPDSFPPALPRMTGRWMGRLSRQTCVTTVPDRDVRADCAASVGQIAAFEMTLTQSREVVTGVSVFDSRTDSLTGTVDRGGLFRFSTSRTIDSRSRNEGLTVIEGIGTFTMSGRFVTGHYVVMTTRSESSTRALDGQTTSSWRIVSMDRI